MKTAATSNSTTPPPARLDATLVDRLSGLASKLRGYLLLQGLARLVAFLVLAGLIQFALDFGVRGLRWSIRAALLGLVVVLAGVVIWRRILVPLMMKIDSADVAKLIERKFPQLSSVLISAVRFAAGQVGPREVNSPELMSTVVERAPQAVLPFDFGRVLAPESVRRSVLVLGGAILLAAIAALASPDKARLWFARNVLLHNTPWPKYTHLILDLPNNELVGARGDDLIITARHEGRTPDEVEIYYTTATGEAGRQTMSAVGREDALQFRFIFKNAREEFTFYLTGGDDTTDEYRVRLLDRPRVESAEILVTPPAYTLLQPFKAGGQERAVQALPGSDIVITIVPNKPLQSATLMKGETQLVTARGHETYFANFKADATATYHFDLLDTDGLEDKNPARFSVRLLKDDPPQSRLRAPGVGEMITPEAILPLEMNASDAYGLATVELRYTLTRESTQEGLIGLSAFTPRMTAFVESLTWPVSSIAPLPGDRLSIRGHASDFDDVSGPKTTDTTEITMRVVTADELQTELARREHEFRMDFERLIDAQEQLRGKLLSLMDTQRGMPSAEFLTAASSLERRQRGIAGSVNVIRQQFEQVLTELRINQLATEAVEQRLGGNIVTPLSELGRRDFALAGDSIRAWSRDAAAEAAVRIDAEQVVLLAKLRAILAHMIQWQGYQEAVSMLRDILRLQEELKNETRNRLKEEGKGVFED